MNRHSDPPRAARPVFAWVPIGAGRLALSHRPGARLILAAPHLAWGDGLVAGERR